MVLRDLQIMALPVKRIGPLEGQDGVVKGLRKDRPQTTIRRVAFHIPALCLTLFLASEYYYGFPASNIISPGGWCLALILIKVAIDYAPWLTVIYRDTLFEHLYTDYVYYTNLVMPLAPTPVPIKRGLKQSSLL